MTTSTNNFETGSPLPLVAGLKRNNAELTYLGAVDFMAAAIVFYCPQCA